MYRLAVVICVVLLASFASPAESQTTHGVGPRLVPVWSSLEPNVPEESRVTDVFLQQRVRNRAPGTVFMLVGGAVAVAGLLADESLLVIGGIVVAGYGLYLYLR
jgi:hypothetical protein